MKQISQNYKTGAIRLESVDQPALKSGGVLVRTQFSVISAGTEGMKVREGKMSMVEKAKARPDHVKKVMKSVKQQGLTATYQKVMNKLDSLTPLGYSLAGTVEAVGAGADEFQIGQRVACAGAGYANHAEVNFIPRNLVVPIPENVSTEHAAFATIGAIAMHGLRQAEMRLGETACVIGLGLIGQILSQLLQANGVKVIGLDLDDGRCKLARELGAAFAGHPEDTASLAAIEQVTHGVGADCIFITAGGKSNKPVELAVEIARDRARVVDIGITKLDIPWKSYFEKELDVRFSRSYGPGRYDPSYEQNGVDYPIGYVRWTERRNMASFLDLIAQGKINLDPIISSTHPFTDAEKIYQDMADGKASGLGILFSYGEPESQEAPPAPPAKTAQVKKGQVRIGLIGAGNYASSMLLPHLAKIKDAALVEVATATSLSAANAERKFNFERTSTDYKNLLVADDIDAALIATRHAAHAFMTAEALRTGKSVFVEKPLALDRASVELVRKAAVEAENDRLLVGFNRRFSPLVQKIAKHFSNPEQPLVINYRVHAGQMDRNSWYLNPDEGTRFLGESGHFIDVFAFLTQARPVSVFAQPLQPEGATADDRDNLSVMISYSDGSVANLQYLTQGGSKVPKEILEVFGAGKTVRLNNFESLDIFEGDNQEKVKASGLDKGQQNEMNSWVAAIKAGSPMPISFDCIIDTTLTSIAAHESMIAGRVVSISEFWQSPSNA